MRRHGSGIGLAVAAWLAVGGPPAAAEDLSPGAGTPFSVRNAAPQDRGTLQLESALGWERGRDGTDAWEVSPGLKYGLTDALELRLGAAYTLGDAAAAGRGSVTPGLRWRLMEQEGWRPTLSLLGEVEAPFGPGDRGATTQLAVLLSRTTGSGPGAWGLHLNAGLLLRPDPGAEERRNGYRWGAAVSHVLDRDTFILAGYAQETQDRGERDLSRLEAGVLRRFGSLSLALVAGAGLNDDSPRFRVTAGVIYELDLSSR